MIEIVEIGIIEGLRIQAVYKDGELIGHNFTPVIEDEE